VTLLCLRGLRNSSAILAKLKNLIEIDSDIDMRDLHWAVTAPEGPVHRTIFNMSAGGYTRWSQGRYGA